ncbi:MAG: hypothetical protein QXI19_13205 [Candidatus Caldarchaeum sp.]
MARRRRGRTIAVKLPQTGKSNVELDQQLDALAPGKRRSASGRIYYERRKNRSDRPGGKI